MRVPLMSGGQIVAAAISAAVAIVSAGWMGYALGHVVGERDEARRILRWVDGSDVQDAVRGAVLGDVGMRER